jgi:hypothetical protein
MTRKKSGIGGGLLFAEQKLKSSGITPSEAEVLGMSVVNAADLDKQFHPVRALKLPYHDIDGSDSGFYRIRYLEELPGFGAQLAKPQRYAQQAGTLNWVYLPKCEGLDWEVVAADTEMPLIITEGELKAASCCLRQRVPTVALGGVTVWQSSKKEVPLLPPLDRFEWQNRRVYIIFDSDAATNEDVARAQLKLADELVRLGALPRIAMLPPTDDGKKQGLDDYIVAGGSVDEVIEDTKQLSLVTKFIGLNNTYAYVFEQDVVLRLSDGTRYKRDTFVNGTHANMREIDYRPSSKGGMARTEISVPKEWLQWTGRRDVNTLVYEPGSPQLTEDGNYNTWKGWGCEPKQGSVFPWKALLDFLFEGSPKEDREWFERWCAYPLQHPGQKLYAAAVLWGPETGTGKSLIGYTLGRIYGQNFEEIGNEELHASFNEWSVNKQFVLGDEITGTDKRSEQDKLKALITRDRMRVNMKFLPTYSVRDCINYYFTSNHPEAFFIDDQDRRLFVHRVRHSRRERQFYVDYMKWLNGGGAAALFHHLLELDLGDFDPTAPAPLTNSKLEMIDHGKSDVSAFVANFSRNLEAELTRLKDLLHLTELPDLVLNKHLRLLYDPDGQSRVTANGLGRELSRAGFKSFPPVNTKAFGMQRFYIVRNTDKWLGVSTDKARDYLEKVYGNMPAAKGKKF